MYQTHYVPAYTNHLLHLMLTMVTLGMWSPVWFIVWLVNHNRTVAKQVWVPAPLPQYQVGQSGGHQGHMHVYHTPHPSPTVPPQAPYRWYAQ